MHLYRIITNVRAGAEQPSCQPGQAGLATVWVQSESEEDALRQAREIVDSRRYEAVGELTVFQEESASAPADPAGAAGDHEAQADPLAWGYLKMRQQALTNRDGLFEIWFSGD